MSRMRVEQGELRQYCLLHAYPSLGTQLIPSISLVRFRPIRGLYLYKLDLDRSEHFFILVRFRPIRGL